MNNTVDGLNVTSETLLKTLNKSEDWLMLRYEDGALIVHEKNNRQSINLIVGLLSILSEEYYRSVLEHVNKHREKIINK